MKNRTNIVIALVMLFGVFSSNSYAQITDENTYIINKYFQVAQNEALLKENGALTNTYTQNNLVQLNQIGNYNQINIKSTSNNTQSIDQIGNSNNYTFINYYNNNASQFNIMQQGNSNSLQIYGQNSIIDNISILQKSNYKTLIITNF